MNVFLTKRNAMLPKILIKVIVFLMFIGFLVLFQEQFKNFFYSISEPLQKTFWKAGNSASNFLGSVFYLNDIIEENEELTIKNRELLEEVAVLQQTKIENQALKDIIGNGQDSQNKEYKLILAETIGIDGCQGYLLINRGSDNGILENMPVINAQKVLVGKIFEVYKNFSKVMLISNKNSVLDIKIQKDDTLSFPIYGVVRGDSNLIAFLDLIPIDSEIKNNDILITSSLDGTFPKDILVGKITEVNKDDLKPFQTAKIQLFFNLNQANKLFIISDYKLK